MFPWAGMPWLGRCGRQLIVLRLKVPGGQRPLVFDPAVSMVSVAPAGRHNRAGFGAIGVGNHAHGEGDRRLTRTSAHSGAAVFCTLVSAAEFLSGAAAASTAPAHNSLGKFGESACQRGENYGRTTSPFKAVSSKVRAHCGHWKNSTTGEFGSSPRIVCQFKGVWQLGQSGAVKTF